MAGFYIKGTTFWERIESQTVIDEATGCHVFTGKSNKRGGHISRWCSDDGKKVYLHRKAWERKNGTIPEGMQILHRCDNPPCWNEDHLFLGDNAMNMADRAAKGGYDNRGSKNANAKLNEAKVDFIRLLLDHGMKQIEIADLYKVSTQTISLINVKGVW